MALASPIKLEFSQDLWSKSTICIEHLLLVYCSPVQPCHVIFWLHKVTEQNVCDVCCESVHNVMFLALSAEKEACQCHWHDRHYKICPCYGHKTLTCQTCCRSIGRWADTLHDRCYSYHGTLPSSLNVHQYVTTHSLKAAFLKTTFSMTQVHSRPWTTEYFTDALSRQDLNMRPRTTIPNLYWGKYLEGARSTVHVTCDRTIWS